MTGVTFPEFLDHFMPETVLYAPNREIYLSAADMVDQAAILKDMFAGRWPSSN